MKKYGLVLVAMLMAYGFSTVAAADTGTYKFGYVDFNRALNEVEEGKRAKSNLKAEFEQKQKKLEMMQKELTAMQQDLEKQRLILSAEALKKKEEIFRKKFIEVNQKLGSYKEEMAKKEIQATGKILNRLRNLVRNIGSKEGYTMILEKSQDVVIYSPPGSDLTSRVIKMFNKGK